MKRATIALAAALLAATGCKQEDIKSFDKSHPMTEFAATRTEYSFFEGGEVLTEKVLAIPFNVVGSPVGHERTARFVVVNDSTTLTKYELLDAKVPANSWTGTLHVKVGNTMGADPVTGEDRPRLYLRTAAGGDFEEGPGNMRDHDIRLQNTLLKPAEWTNALSNYGGIGEYSTAYYSFIIEATGETHFPIRMPVAGYYNGELWPVGYSAAFLTTLRDKLRERNQREGSPLLHDDGPGKGQEIVVGKYPYTPL